MAHGAIEDECGSFTCGKFGSVKFKAIPPHTDEWQAARAPCMNDGFGLPVLCYCHVLTVVVNIKRAIYCPVVRNHHRFPFCIVKADITEIRLILASEFPPFLECVLHTHLCSHPNRNKY